MEDATYKTPLPPEVRVETWDGDGVFQLWLDDQPFAEYSVSRPPSADELMGDLLSAYDSAHMHKVQQIVNHLAERGLVL